MIRTRSVVALAALSLLGASALWSEAADAQCASLTTAGTASTQNFDGLSSVVAAGVAWTDNSTVPGWYSTRTTYNVATGSSNTGALYSFGVAGTNPVTDRALGGIASGTTGTFYWAGCFTNNTGSPLTGVDIAYIGEQWRDGGNATNVAQSLVFQYQVANAGVITDADTPTTGWVNAPALDFSSPIFTTTAGALDGNAGANRTAKSATLAVPVAVGQQVWIRWRDINDAGNDHGLGIDDVSLTGRAPAISLVKTVGTNPGVCAATPTITVASGTTVYYCYAVTNTGAVTLNLHNLVDDQLGGIFSGLSYALTPGSSVNTVQAGLSIPAVINATTTNTATWTAYNAGPVDQVTAQASATVTVVVVDADLSIVMTDSPDPVTAGNNITYSITMTNTGPDAAQNARFSVPLPAGTTLVSTAPSAGGVCASVSPIVCTWAGATANAGIRTATIVVAVPASTAHGALLASSATAASDTADSDPADNLSTVSTSVVTAANLAMALTDSPDPVIAGNQLTYVATVSNAGPSDAQGVNFSLQLPAGTTFVSVTPNTPATCNAVSPVVCTWAGATAPGVNRGATIVVNVAANVANGTLLSAVATASSATTDPSAANNTAQANTAVNASADLSITLTDGPDPVTTGTNLTYTATLSNAGPSDAQGANIALPLPAGTSLVSATASAGGACAGTTTVTCTWTGATAPGVNRTATIVVLVSSGHTAGLTATATAASTTNDPGPSVNTATATTVVEVRADLSVTLTDAPDPVIAGTNLTYTAVITNAGPSDATGVSTSLSVPANTSFVSGSVSGGGACAGSPVVCTVTGSMLPNTTRTITLVMLVAPSAPENSTITAPILVSAGSPDPNPANNSATTTTAVITRADLLLGFSASVAQTLINVPVTFTATSLNQGPSDAQGVSVTITLTPDFRYSSHTAAGAICTTPQVGNTGAIVCTWAGATIPGVTRTLTVVAFSNVEGATGVSASTTSSTFDPVPNNNSGNLIVQVGYLVEEIPTLSNYGLILLGLLFGLIGFVAVRRQA